MEIAIGILSILLGLFAFLMSIIVDITLDNEKFMMQKILELQKEINKLKKEV